MQNLKDDSHLYLRWLEVLQRYSDEVALVDSEGISHRFRDLAAAVDGRCAVEKPEVAGVGDGMGFVVSALAAWRDGQPFVPVDSISPEDALLENLPPGVAHVKMTSGSTGAPRLLLFSGDQMAADAANIVATMGLRREWANLGVISMAHSYGFSNLVLPLLLHGIPLILAKDALPTSVARAMEMAEGGVVLPAVPAMWKTWHRAGILNAERVRLAISAGAPLTGDLERTVFEEAGIKIHNFLGSSECGGIAFDRSDVPRGDERLAGTAMDDVRLEIGVGACLAVRGGAVGLRYWPNEDPALTGGVFQTEDLVSFGENGNLLLEGRVGDLINVAGRKVSPATIEAVIMNGQDAGQCVVFGIASSDYERVQEIVACVQRVDDLQALKSYVRKNLPSWQVPRHWRVEPELKPDKRGKTSRHIWRERFLSSQE